MYSPSLQRSRFVEDLIYPILESTNHWWPGDLARLAQVSSAWLGPVRRRLYTAPNVHSFRASTKLAQSLLDNASLLSLVKAVELRPMPRDGEHISSQDRNSLNVILSIEGLQRITLGGLLSVRAERFLHRVADAPSILNLHIDGSSIAYHFSLIDCPSFEWDESMAFQFCNLKALRLTNIELGISFPSIPYQLHLSELLLDHVTITRGYLAQLLHETPSLACLRVRCAQASELDEQVRLVLDACAVETLEFEVDVEAPLHHFLFDNDLFSLRSLHLRGVQVDPDTLNSIGEHCRNLENLAISGRIVTMLPSEWASLITSGRLVHLRSLRIPWGNMKTYPLLPGWSSSAIGKLLEAAALYGISISIEGNQT